jgi:hypothetical protein
MGHDEAHTRTAPQHVNSIVYVAKKTKRRECSTTYNINTKYVAYSTTTWKNQLWHYHFDLERQTIPENYEGLYNQLNNGKQS